MADEGKNNTPLGDAAQNESKREFDAVEDTREIGPVKDGGESGEGGDGGETKTFTAVSADAAREQGGETRSFTIDAGGKKPLEKCEERGSVKSYNAWTVIWKITRPFLILVVSLALVAFLAYRGYHYIEDSYFTPVDVETQETKKIEIKPGSSLSSIATTLFEEGIIRNKFVFQMYVDLNDMGNKLLAGKYEFSPSMTMDEIIAILGEGDGGRKVAEVTFTEGMTAEDIAETLQQSGILDAFQKVEFLALCDDRETFKEDYPFIRQIAVRRDVVERKYLLEGYLFPDTYQFYIDETPENIVRRLLDRFDDIFTLTFEDRADELGLRIDEVIVLASMIEWEGLPADFKKVSAVFHNRVELNMPMQSCATMRYVTGERKLEYTADQLAIESPYNTYQIEGLPVGPVANPGEKAIEASLYPDEEYLEEDYIYFCNKDNESGELLFARSLEEHNENKAAYNEATNSQTYSTEEESEEESEESEEEDND